MADGHDDENPNDRNMVLLKSSLQNILRNPQHLAIYRDTVKTINKVVTAGYLFARYIFVYAYDDDEEFNADEYITSGFFNEVLKSLQTRPRKQATSHETLRYRQLINRYLEEFLVDYRFRPMQVAGNSSNWEAYVSRQMCTAYLNNAEMRSGQHLRAIINVLFDVKELRSTVRRNAATAAEKALARAYFADIASFKDITGNANSFDEILGRMDELQDLGEEFVECFHFLSPILEGIGNGNYRKGSLWYEIAASKSVNTLYQIARLSSQLPAYVNRPAVRLQPFPLRHSFIPAYVPFDRTVVACQILRQDRKGAYQNQEFWKEHFRLNRRPFLPGPGGREFDGTFWTDGVGVSILKRTPGTEKGAGRKRKRGTKRKDRDRDLFPYFNTFAPEELAEYQDVVFADPNRRDMLFMMHKDSLRSSPRILRYTSMSRRRHLGTKINRDREQRFIKRQPNAADIKTAKEQLSRTKCQTISPMEFQAYVSQRSEAKEILGPLYEDVFFRKNRWRSSIGNQRDKALLGNLIRRKFGPNPLIVLGDGSPPTVRFHQPTKGVGLRMDLLRLGFRVVLIDEFKTSTSCPDCFSRTNTFLRRPSPRPWRKHVEQTVHGLLECRGAECREYCNGNSRKWNRDLLAVLNFKRVWSAHMHGRERPADLKRGH